MRLVFVKKFVAESGRPRVKSNRDVSRAVLADRRNQVPQEPVSPMRLLTCAVRQPAASRQREPRTKHHRMSVDDKDEGFSVGGLGLDCHARSG